MAVQVPLARAEIVTAGIYRLRETDGRLCHSWLLGVEDDDWLPVDRGGFEEMHDAVGFKLAIDLIRSDAALIDVTPEIEVERAKLDEIKSGRLPTKEPQAALDRLADRIRESGPSIGAFGQGERL